MFQKHVFHTQSKHVWIQLLALGWRKEAMGMSFLVITELKDAMRMKVEHMLIWPFMEKEVQRFK